MSHKILSGKFNPTGRIMTIDTKTGKRVILEGVLRPWLDGIYCTDKRHNGPLFNDKGVCTSGHSLIAVNYVEVKNESV